jgi:hypothetical protein
VRRTIKAGLFKKPRIKHHRSAVDRSLRLTKQTSRLSGVNDLCGRRPSTRGATAPQRAQRVNFVVCRWGLVVQESLGNSGREFNLND